MARGYRRSTGASLRAKPIQVDAPAGPAERVVVYVNREQLDEQGRASGATLEHVITIDGADPAAVEIRVLPR